nr:hypothetical protein GCM10020092_056550 [Actinoplanes digitatis]
MPICRAVDAIPPATPDRAGGSPPTAVLVIGAFAKPTPIPANRYAVSSTAGAVRSSSPTSRAPAIAVQTPASRSGRRGPTRPTRYPDSGAQTVAATAIGRVNAPAAIGLSPRTCCR